MSGEKTWCGLTLLSASPLLNSTYGTGHLFKAVGRNGDIVATGSSAAGILQTNADSGRPISVAWHGEFQYVAAVAIVAGGKLAITTSGYLTNPASGDVVVGWNSEIAAGSGDVARGIFDFATPPRWAVQSINLDGTFTFAAAADLSAATGFAVHISSGDYVGNLIQQPDAVVITGTVSGGTSIGKGLGVTQVRAGDVIVNGRNLTVAASGWFIQATSGTLVAGKALAASAAGNSGGLFNAMLNLATPHWASTSADVTLF